MKSPYILPVSEHQIQSDIIGYLRYKGFYVTRMNSGKMRYTNARGGTNLLHLHEAGTPDVLAIREGRCFFIEVKRPGNKPTRLQTMKMAELEEFGAKCIVAYSIDDLKDII